MTIYRKIYEQNFGPIPKDENGRSFEIHHIDGNHKNNHISNLMCVSIDQHYDIHISQNDWWAALMIAKRMFMMEAGIIFSTQGKPYVKIN